MVDSGSERRRGKRKGRAGLLLSVLVAAFLAASVALAGFWESYRRRTQMRNDPRVARVWVGGTTFGMAHQLQRGAGLQKWLNTRHISLLGDYELVQSQYANDPGSMEIWFNYESYLIGQPDLECHRVSPSGTAFIDDLGQPYHGFLDIHGKTVGVYLPGYDHAAREIHCTLHWMPRRPANPLPVSRPMSFTVKLPPATRILPLAETLPRTVTVRKNGITVTVEAARLGPFKSSTGATGQRDLTFHLKIDGGKVVNDNVASDIDLSVPDSARAARIRTIIGAPVNLNFGSPRLKFNPAPNARRAQQQLLAFANSSYERPMSLTDPYGFPLIVPGQSVTPLISKETLAAARRGEGMVWVVPVQNAGKGTDAMRLNINVLPKERSGQTEPPASIPIDLVVPVQSGDEI